ATGELGLEIAGRRGDPDENAVLGPAGHLRLGVEFGQQGDEGGRVAGVESRGRRGGPRGGLGGGGLAERRPGAEGGGEDRGAKVSDHAVPLAEGRGGSEAPVRVARGRDEG